MCHGHLLMILKEKKLLNVLCKRNAIKQIKKTLELKIKMERLQ